MPLETTEMPLHLLGKKSWNVYNSQNIERVRRDEELARRTAAEAEHDRYDREAADRIRRLRGEPLLEQDVATTNGTTTSRKRKHTDSHDERDEDFRKAVDKIDGEGKKSRRREAEETNVDLDKITNMRFRDAAGRNSTGAESWYLSSHSLEPAGDKTVGHDAFGRADVRRHARDEKRLMAADPLAAMKRGVKQLREIEKQRAAWREERERDLNEVEELARRREHRKRRREKKDDVESEHKHRRRRSDHDRHQDPD